MAICEARRWTHGAEHVLEDIPTGECLFWGLEAGGADCGRVDRHHLRRRLALGGELILKIHGLEGTRVRLAMGNERKDTAGILTVETQMIIVYIPARRPSWMSRVSVVTKPNNHANGNGDARRAIEYHDAENGSAGYTDTPVVRVEDADADAEDEPGDSPRSRQGSVQRAIEARLGIDGEHDEHHTLVASSQTSNDQNEWARS